MAKTHFRKFFGFYLPLLVGLGFYYLGLFLCDFFGSPVLEKYLLDGTRGAILSLILTPVFAVVALMCLVLFFAHILVLYRRYRFSKSTSRRELFFNGLKVPLTFITGKCLLIVPTMSLLQSIA